MIGILDSGIGGLSIYYELKRRMPNAGVIYLADKVNFPYGEKTETELVGIVRRAVQTLISSGATVIILACNTATVTAIATMRAEFDLPFVGIEPAVKQASANTKNGKIGVLATKKTTEVHDVTSLAGSNDILRVDASGLVAQIESNLGVVDSDMLDVSMAPIVDFGADTVVLGCTHFSFVASKLREQFPETNFLEPTEAVVNRLEAVIAENKLDIEQADDIFLGIDESDLRKIHR